MCLGYGIYHFYNTIETYETYDDIDPFYQTLNWNTNVVLVLPFIALMYIGILGLLRKDHLYHHRYVNTCPFLFLCFIFILYFIF